MEKRNTKKNCHQVLTINPFKGVTKSMLATASGRSKSLIYKKLSDGDWLFIRQRILKFQRYIHIAYNTQKK